MLKGIKKGIAILVTGLMVAVFSACNIFGGINNLKGSVKTDETKWIEAFNNASRALVEEGFTIIDKKEAFSDLGNITAFSKLGAKAIACAKEVDGKQTWIYFTRREGMGITVRQYEGKWFGVIDKGLSVLGAWCEFYSEGALDILWDTYDINEYSKWAYNEETSIYTTVNKECAYEVKIADGVVRHIKRENIGEKVSGCNTAPVELIIGEPNIEIPEYEMYEG